MLIIGIGIDPPTPCKNDEQEVMNANHFSGSQASSGALKGGLKQLLPSFVATKRKLNGSGIQRNHETDWKHFLLELDKIQLLRSSRHASSQTDFQ